MRLTTDAAKLLESARKELGLGEQKCDEIIERAGEQAQLDYCPMIEDRHMLHALAGVERSPKWHIQDFGECGPENSVWLYCKNIRARDLMEIGNTCYLDFQTGAGKDTLKVVRVN